MKIQASLGYPKRILVLLHPPAADRSSAYVTDFVLFFGILLIISTSAKVIGVIGIELN